MDVTPTRSARFIDWLTYSKVAYPLYDHLKNPVLYYFSLRDSRGWKHPAALDVNSSISVNLNKDVFQELSEPYFLEARLKGMPVFQWRGGNENLGASMSPVLALIPPTVNGQAKPLPWAIRGTLNWTLQGCNPLQPKFIMTSPIEVYVFRKLPDYFAKAGIPLALLRLDAYLPAWMRTSSWSTPSDIPFTWSTFIVNQVFSDTQLEYEQWGGMCKYTSWDRFDTLQDVFTKNRGLDFWLDFWLLNKTLPGKLAVNCYDLAALCQILVSLGVDTSSVDLRMKYMSPFGYLHPTRLIGRTENAVNPENPENLCNNPFYGSPSNDRRMLCPDNSPIRSAFGNHMFLTMAENEGMPYVFDACCGPQLGTISLMDYPNSVIDSRGVFYNNSRRPGTIADMYDGPGVDNLVISRCFDRTHIRSDPLSLALMDQLAAFLQPHGRLTQPYLTAPAETQAITGTWVFLPNAPSFDAQETVVINIYKFSFELALHRAFRYRYDSMPNWVQNTPQDIQNDDRTGSLRMFINTQNFYLTTIDARHGKAESTLYIRDIIQSVIGFIPILTALWPNSWMQNIVKEPADMPQPIGTMFKVTIQATDRGEYYCRGYNVRVSKGHILFMGVHQEPDGFWFEFLGRSNGFDTAVITMYGGNLESESRTVNFWIAPHVVYTSTIPSMEPFAIQPSMYVVGGDFAQDEIVFTSNLVMFQPNS